MRYENVIFLFSCDFDNVTLFPNFEKSRTPEKERVIKYAACTLYIHINTVSAFDLQDFLF